MGIRTPDRASFGGKARIFAYALISLATVIFSISVLPQNAFAASVSSASVSSFASYPSGYILLNQPIEYSVTPPPPSTATETYTATKQVPYTAYNQVPYTAYEQVPYTAYHYNVPYTAYRQVSYTAYRQVPYTAYRQVSYTAYHNVPYTAYHNVPYTAYHTVAYTAYRQVWVSSGYWQPYKACWAATWSWVYVGRAPNYTLYRGHYYFNGTYHNVYRWEETRAPGCSFYHRWINTSHYVSQAYTAYHYNVPYTAWHYNVPYTAWHYNVPYTAYRTVAYTAYNTVAYTAYETVAYTAYKTVAYTAYNTVAYTAYKQVPYTAYKTVSYTATATGTLVGIQPGIQDTTQGQYYNETYSGPMCETSTTPLISPSSSAFPDYSGQVWKYTSFFESNNVCTFDPTFIQGNNVQSWLLANNQARLTFTPEYSFDINGATQIVGGQTLYGPSWSLDSISSSTCSIINQYTYCPGQPPVKTPTG